VRGELGGKGISLRSHDKVGMGVGGLRFAQDDKGVWGRCGRAGTPGAPFITGAPFILFDNLRL
jgi:hypothetical protein